jgi:hypothetical protein
MADDKEFILLTLHGFRYSWNNIKNLIVGENELTAIDERIT